MFTEQEFGRRLQRLRDYMTVQDIDAVVLTSYHNINYYTGFLFCYFGRKYGAVVTPDKCVTISAGIDGGQPWRRSSCDNLTYTDWHRGNFYRAVDNVFQESHSSVGKIGLEFDHITLDLKAHFEDFYPKSSVVDVNEALMRHRMVKSPEEQALIRQGARIADLGGAAVRDAAREGVSEYEVAIASTTAMIREIAKTYPDVELMDSTLHLCVNYFLSATEKPQKYFLGLCSPNSKFRCCSCNAPFARQTRTRIFANSWRLCPFCLQAWTWFQSGINTDGAHNPVTTRKLQKGDILSLNCFPMIAG